MTGVVVVMGVTSTGKTTIGERLAAHLGARFAEGDSYHPKANVAKMRAGTPLNDEDRWPWLQAIAADMRKWMESGTPAVVACSALKQAYRDILRGADPGVRFVHLEGDPMVLRQRIEQRSGHYMPPTLLPSQLATLEDPSTEPDVVTVGVGGTPDEIFAEVLEKLGSLEHRAR